jgi:hypothetical protein
VDATQRAGGNACAQGRRRNVLNQILRGAVINRAGARSRRADGGRQRIELALEKNGFNDISYYWLDRGAVTLKSADKHTDSIVGKATRHGAGGSVTRLAINR